MCVDSKVAEELSQALIAEAVAHIDKHVSDAEWMRKNRQLAAGADFAYWVIVGSNFLTIKEQEALKHVYSDKGWRYAYPQYSHHNKNTNWTMTVQLAC